MVRISSSRALQLDGFLRGPRPQSEEDVSDALAEQAMLWRTSLLSNGRSLMDDMAFFQRASASKWPG
jgi:hypothetical protein